MTKVVIYFFSIQSGARAFSDFAPTLEDTLAPAPSGLQTPGVIDSHQTMTARALSPAFSVMLAQNGHRLLYTPSVTRTHSANVHDYVPAILGGARVPLERGVRAAVTMEVGEQQGWGVPPGVGLHPYGRGILLRRSPSEAAVYASIPLIRSPQYEALNSHSDQRSQLGHHQGVRRTQSDASAGVLSAPPTNPSDIYAVPHKVRRARHTPEDEEEGVRPAESPLPPPLPPPFTAHPGDHVVQTVRGTAALSLGPEQQTGGEPTEDNEGILVVEEHGEDMQSPQGKGEAGRDPGGDPQQGTGGRRFTVLLASGQDDHTVAAPGPQNGLTQGFGQTEAPDLTRHLPAFDHTGKGTTHLLHHLWLVPLLLNNHHVSSPCGTFYCPR